MSLFPAGQNRLYGVYEGIVTDVSTFRLDQTIQVDLPWLAAADSQHATVRARLATMMAGANRGTYFLPHVGDEVLISFLSGHPSHPVIVGSLWNGQDDPPEDPADSGATDNEIQSFTTRGGHVLRFSDGPSPHVELQTTNGHSLRLDDASSTITLTHSTGAQLEMDAQGNVRINALSSVHISAPNKMTIQTLKLEVNAPMADFSGVVKCLQVSTSFVNSAAYTPGAGNVW